ncbi:MAG: response regulator [Planctomycetes bacterium]|jgi:CheY-like chemotaxis protein|nr:response regulator [Phycisphaerae bacterium]NBB95144.1 response regulator [Planctomycetota bacterium]
MPGKVLIVDDEPYIVHVLSMKLGNAGYDVVTAGDGEEGLEVARAEQPDLIITDYQMACLDGLAMCRAYRQDSGQPVPAMVITAREFDIEADTLDGTGVEVILPKPFSPRHVVDTIDHILQEHRKVADVDVSGAGG